MAKKLTRNQESITLQLSLVDNKGVQYGVDEPITPGRYTSKLSIELGNAQAPTEPLTVLLVMMFLNEHGEEVQTEVYSEAITLSEVTTQELELLTAEVADDKRIAWLLCHVLFFLGDEIFIDKPDVRALYRFPVQPK